MPDHIFRSTSEHCKHVLRLCDPVLFFLSESLGERLKSLQNKVKDGPEEDTDEQLQDFRKDRYKQLQTVAVIVSNF